MLSITLAIRLRELYRRLLALRFSSYQVLYEVNNTRYSWKKGTDIAADLEFAEIECFSKFDDMKFTKKCLLERKAELERYINYVKGTL